MDQSISKRNNITERLVTSSFEYPLESTEAGFMAYFRVIDPDVDMWWHPTIPMAIVLRPSDPWFHKEIEEIAEMHRPIGVLVQVVPWHTLYGIGLPVPPYRRERWWRALYRSLRRVI